MTNNEILNNAHTIRENLMKKIMPYISKKTDFKAINNIYMNELLKYTNDVDSYMLDKPKKIKFKGPKNKNTRYIFVNLYVIFANITNVYISSLDEDTDIFFSGFELYGEDDFDIIEKAIEDFKAGKLLDDEILEYTTANDPDDLKLIVKNNMIDIYLIQKLTHVREYTYLLLILNQVKLLGSYKDDYIYRFIIKIANLLK